MKRKDDDVDASTSMAKSDGSSDEVLNLGPTRGGTIGGGASGPRVPTSNDEAPAAGTDEPGSDRTPRTDRVGPAQTAVLQHNEAEQAQAPRERGQEEIENYGSRRDATDSGK